MVYSAQIGAKKPDRPFFEAALKRCGYSPGDIVLVDDMKANVEAALAFGWSAVQWREGLSLRSIVDFA